MRTYSVDADLMEQNFEPDWNACRPDLSLGLVVRRPPSGVLRVHRRQGLLLGRTRWVCKDANAPVRKPAEDTRVQTGVCLDHPAAIVSLTVTYDGDPDEKVCRIADVSKQPCVNVFLPYSRYFRFPIYPRPVHTAVCNCLLTCVCSKRSVRYLKPCRMEKVRQKTVLPRHPLDLS